MIPEPKKGHPVGAAWAADVTRAANRCTAEIDAVKNPAPPANRRSPSGVHPWMVVGGTDDGDAKLAVYVPKGSLVVADEEIDAGDIDGLTAVDGAPGYYTVDDLGDLATTAAGAQPLYLVVWRNDADESDTDPEANAVKAAVALDPESAEGTVLLQATVALVWASTPEGGSKTYGAVSEQVVRSAVHVGRGEGGEGGETEGVTGYRYFFQGFALVNDGESGSAASWVLRISYAPGRFENGLLVEDGDEQHVDIPVSLHSSIAQGE